MRTAKKPGKTETSKGKHGGNRGGEHARRSQRTARTSQAAGKDPARGKG